MLQLINHARTQRGLAPLHVHAALSRAALAHSRDMMRRHYFSHSSPGGASCGARARQRRLFDERLSILGRRRR